MMHSGENVTFIFADISRVSHCINPLNKAPRRKNATINLFRHLFLFPDRDDYTGGDFACH